MNMLPINQEWKRRIKWADNQRKQQKQASKRFDRLKTDDKITVPGRTR